MNALFLAAGLAVAGSPAFSPLVSDAAALDALFLAQRQEVAREMRDEMRVDLRQRSIRFFAANGELRDLLDVPLVANAELASR